MAIPMVCRCGRSFLASETDVGGLAACPWCGLESPVPKKPRGEDWYFIGDDGPVRTSGAAVASLVQGLGFLFTCVAGVPAILCGIQALESIRMSRGRLRGRWQANAGIILGLLGCVLTFAPSHLFYSTPREAARRSQCVNNLKQIGLALHNYHEAHGRFPPAAIAGKDGKPLLSWRVAILPYMEQEGLYAKFHLDEPWDSPHNRTLLDKTPNFYICPSDKEHKPGTTHYQAIVGAGAAFAADPWPLRLADFTDGTSDTIAVGESRRKVPWSKPDDIPIDLAPALMSSAHPGGSNALFVDGSVRFQKSSADPRALRSLLTRDGGEILAGDSQ